MITSVQPARAEIGERRGRRGSSRRPPAPRDRSPGSPRSTIGPATRCASASSAPTCTSRRTAIFDRRAGRAARTPRGTSRRDRSPRRASLRARSGTRRRAGRRGRPRVRRRAPIHTSSGSGGTGAMRAFGIANGASVLTSSPAHSRRMMSSAASKRDGRCAQRRAERVELLGAAAERALHDERSLPRSTRACRSARRAAPDARAGAGTARPPGGRPTRRAGGRASGRSGSRAPARCGGRR